MSFDDAEKRAAEFEALGQAIAEERKLGAVKAKPGRTRPIQLIDKTGKVVANTTLGKVLAGVALAADVEIAVQEGKRPQRVKCIECPRLVKVKRGNLPKRCATCAATAKREQQRERREANPEAARAAARKWRAANPEAVAQSQARRRAENPEAARTAERKWYAANREAAREAQRKRYAANPESKLEAERRRRKENPEARAAVERKWYVANRETALARKRAYKARKKAEREAAKAPTS